MPIPTLKQIADRKRSAKARKVMLENKAAKRKAEGREPDTREGRQQRKLENASHHKGVKHARTEVQRVERAANDKIAVLLTEIAVLQAIDSEGLLDVIVQDRDKDKGKEPIDLLKALDLRSQGCSLAMICQTCKTTIGKLRGLFKRYDTAHNKVLSYKGYRADILADMQRRIIKSITDADIKHATLGARLKALCQLYDKERLERDLSTANVFNIHDDIAAIKESAMATKMAMSVKAKKTLTAVQIEDLNMAKKQAAAAARPSQPVRVEVDRPTSTAVQPLLTKLNMPALPAPARPAK